MFGYKFIFILEIARKDNNSIPYSTKCKIFLDFFIGKFVSLAKTFRILIIYVVW